MRKVFCRWIMGLNGATESIGFSIPERENNLPSCVHAWRREGLCATHSRTGFFSLPFLFFSSRYVHSIGKVGVKVGIPEKNGVL